MDAAAAAVSTLSALAVFVSTVHKGTVRSAHGYRVVGRREWERWVEREYAFSPTACREVPLPAGAPRILPTDWRGRPVYREGQLVGPWRCILAFDSVAGVAPPPTLPPLLSPSGNARLICCVPSLYNDLLKLFPFQRLQKVPEPIQCNNSDKHKTPSGAKDVVPNKKVHTAPVHCDPGKQKPPLDTKNIISKKAHTEELIQCGSGEQKTPLDVKDSLPQKAHNEIIQCDSDEQKPSLDARDMVSEKVRQPGSNSDEQRTSLDTKDIITFKKVHTEPIQCDLDDQKTPLDTKGKVRTELIQCGSYEQRTPLDLKDRIAIKVQLSGSDSDVHRRSGEELPTPVQKQRRAQREYIASLTLGDIAQYFHLPIREASRTLQIGLSILKKKCRQYGIPRWPHRKIKSLDSLIQDLEYVINDTEKDGAEQEDDMDQEEEKDDAIRSLAKRKRDLETEMATIHQKPTLDLMTETKQFRQFVFKRRYKAKHLVDEE